MNISLVKYRNNTWSRIKNAFQVYAQLFTHGIIEQKAEGKNFVLICALNLTGDLNNLIIYTGSKKLSQSEMLELLSEDDKLLGSFEKVSRELIHKMKGISTLPLAFNTTLSAIVLGLTYYHLEESFREIINLNWKNFDWQTLLIALELIGLPLLHVKRFWLPKYLMKVIGYLLKAYRWIKKILS